MLTAFALRGDSASPVCGTGPAVSQRAAALASRSHLGKRRFEPLATQTIEAVDGVAVIRADDRTAPNLRLFDLEYSILTFTPGGGETYLVTRMGIRPQEERGTRLPLGSSNEVSYRLPFDFPVFERPIRDVFITRFNAIQTTPAATPAFWQYDALEMIAQRSPLISPMLTTPKVQDPYPSPEIYVRETATSVTITWATPANHFPVIDVRATLFRDGRIQFAYVHITEQPCAVVVTSGAERWRNTVSRLGAVDDPAGDLPFQVPATVAPMLDVVASRVSRVAALDLVRLEFDFAASPDPVLAAPVGVLRHTIGFVRGSDTYEIGLEIEPDGSIEVNAPRAVNGFRGPAISAAARLHGRTLTLEVTDDLLPYAPTAVTIQTTRSWIADHASIPVQFDTPRDNVMTNLSALPQGGAIRFVVLEAFTRPSVSLHDIWHILQGVYGWRDEDVDAVVVYENFATDIGFFGSAYALAGNPGVDGIGPGSGRDHPRFPNLMDLARPDTAFADAHDNLVLHEFGHRWLYHFAYRDPATGENRHDLNPDRTHPAQWVDTRAAFQVASPVDSSAMGGGVFTEKPDSRFDIAEVSPFSFSWLELYLMGLANSNEVAPFIWIENSEPPLGIAYFPYESSVRGTKRVVDVRDVIAAEGVRIPAYPATQRRFTIAFVLLADPSKPVYDVHVAAVARARDMLVRDFSAASGGRGQIEVLSVQAGTLRRRGVRH